VKGPGSWEFEQPGRFTVGAVGEPGARFFYLQVFADATEVNVKCEKQQAAALAEHLGSLLKDLPGGVPTAATPSEALPPTEVAFVVGSISLGIDPDAERLVVLLEELLVDPETGDALDRDPGRLRVHLDRDQAAGLIAQVGVLLATGRPICRLCEQPIDPDGHACPRLN
jgi:uncharacterized repeat protein (TIGR03847 family)